MYVCNDNVLRAFCQRGHEAIGALGVAPEVAGSRIEAKTEFSRNDPMA
jgi:hypothetical protein